ncbi:AraC family transcriptional regulator [Reyranella sp.]|jgi:AraC-like DNA-binding protein|uniref:AraC family transcriptional regulator n=1 Tax=Reyranella sp. TaxID=1929291 RepID=UPI002F93B79B
MTDLIRSACLSSYREVARSVGLPPLKMLAAVGIDSRCLDDPDIKMPTGALGRLLEASARAAKVEDFGLRLAETRSLAVLGPVGLLVCQEPTVREAMVALARYIRVHNEAMLIRMEELGDDAIVSVELHLTRPAPVRQGIELAVGVLYRVLRSLLGADWRPLVQFTHDAPADRRTHRRIFGTRVEFGRDFNGIVCRRRDLDHPVPSANPTLARYARLQLETMLARPNATMEDKVRELVRLQLPAGRCTIEHVARQLDVDRRTLHRKLAAEGRTFSDILESVRTEIATRILQSRERPLTAVADLLGFSDLSAFSRWFRARFGLSPSAWRTRLARTA